MLLPSFFFFNDTATTEIYTLSLHDALPICWLTEREFLDAVAMGMITPGPVVITAVFVGYLVAGLAGASVAGLGVFLPPFLMVVLFAPWIMRYRKHPIVVGFTKGATAAAAGAIVGAGAVIGTQVIVDLTTVLVFLAALLVLC